MYKLTDEQKDFLKAEGNVVLQACPGSGKTYIVAKKLLQYLKNWDRPHQGVAVLSFTNVASVEVENQTKELMPDGFKIEYPHFIGTIDSFINNYILLRFGYLFISPRKRPMIAIKDLFSIPLNSWKNECHRNKCVDDIHDFRWDIKGNILRNNKSMRCNIHKDIRPCHQYKRILLKNGFIFQSDAAVVSYWLLKKYPVIAQAVAARFPIIILDEAQDTSKEQMAILDLINDAGTESMFLVGDPDQSIYEWRNATPECFIDKMSDNNWTTLTLSKNFRSSQLICDATQAFSYTLKGKTASKSEGVCAKFNQKPVLMLFDGDVDDIRQKLINKFLKICKKNKISNGPDNIAIVTRRRIHKNTNIKRLWKSKEVELFAQAAYEWSEGKRSNAYELCEKALFSLVIKEFREINVSIKSDIQEVMDYEIWRYVVIDFLIKLPNANLPLEEWITQMRKVLENTLMENSLSIRDNRSIEDIVKIKKRDDEIRHFKSIPLRQYFEVQSKDNKYTLSSVHGVKGKTYDALMLIVESKTGKTITPAMLNDGDLNDENMRIAYVAMTRPRKVLVVAMPKVKSRKVYRRFPNDKWVYEYITLNS